MHLRKLFSDLRRHFRRDPGLTQDFAVLPRKEREWARTDASVDEDRESTSVHARERTRSRYAVLGEMVEEPCFALGALLILLLVDAGKKRGPVVELEPVVGIDRSGRHRRDASNAHAKNHAERF